MRENSMFKDTADKLIEAACRISKRGDAWGYSGRKVFLVDVAQEINVPLKRLAGLLVAFHHLGWLDLARADLVSAMDLQQVRDSEIDFAGIARFHFLTVDPETCFHGLGGDAVASELVVAYHGSSVPIRRFSRKFSAQGVFWFSSDKAKILRGESGAVSAQYLMTCKLDVGSVAGWDEYERLGLSQIEAKFDSIHLDDDWVIFDTKRIKVTKIEEGNRD